MYWKDQLESISALTEQTHLKVQDMIPPENYVRFQPDLPTDRVFKFDGYSYEDN